MIGLLFAAGAFSLGAEPLIWQLGTPNGSEREFHPYYNAWEYGIAPEIQKSPAMDHQTHTFHFEIEENKLIPNPQLVSGVATETERQWMNADEIVSGVRLSWKETAPGNRLLSLTAVNWTNPLKGRDGIEITLPEGGVKVLNLPDGWGKKDATVPFEVVFPVKAGTNEMTIRIVSPAKHYRFQFDSIALSATDRKPDVLPPLLKSEFDAPDGIYHPGEPVKLAFGTRNLSSGSLSYVVKDAFGRQVAAGTAGIADSKAEISLPSSVRGYFGVDSTVGKREFHTSYVVIEPVKAESLPDSRFGCHALETDGYRLRNWPEIQEQDVRRAFQAGAKWLRHHSIHWFLREPEKGKFDWTYFDDRLAVAEKYKMNVMVTLGGTPKWASSSDDTKMTSCGTFYYQNYPPKSWQDWTDFVTAVVTRYKDKIQWFELWNEPGYSSAFWTNGSAKEFGMLLKTGYEAAKKADPGCKVLSGAPLTPGFLEDAVKSNGGKLDFDVMSFHYSGSDKRGGELFAKWKLLLTTLGGGDIPLVNTEEMSWTRPDPLDFSAALLKLYVREAAQGIAKTFAFDFFRSGSQFGASAFDLYGAPLPQYAAYRTMTHRLEHAKFVADLSTAETEVYLFDRQGTPVLAVWSDQKATVKLPFGAASGTLVNLMDVESPLSAANGMLERNGTPLPVFVEGGDLKLLAAYGRMMDALPGQLTLKPGSGTTLSLKLPDGVSNLKLAVPAGWSGVLDRSRLAMSVPKGASDGIYDLKINGEIAGYPFEIPLLVEVSSLTPGANLVLNGDFTRGSSNFFYPKEKEKFDTIRGGGINGTDAVRTRGTVFFGYAGRIKVRPGEKYAVIVEAKGDGTFGGVYSLQDKQGKKVFPQKDGINCLFRRVGPEWQTFCDEISIDQPDAATLSFSILANHGDQTGGKEIEFNRLAIIRLTEKMTRSKALWQGVCVKTSGAPADWNKIPAMTVDSESEVVKSGEVKWNGANDLSASCRMAMDKQFLYLRFAVKDDTDDPPKAEEKNVWENDSIQIAFDPPMAGKERTEIAIYRNPDGKCTAYKLINFWTPEIPENLTRRGPMPDVKIAAAKTAGGVDYTVTIPLRELYPLTDRTAEFGFSWLVNDNDGRGRKYIQWSSGIGPSKDTSLFGIVKCITEK